MVDQAIGILREFEPPEGYVLAFSGGKDSQVLLRVAEMAGVRFEAIYKMTTIDPPELVQFMRREYPQVKWSRPKRTFYKFIESGNRGLPGGRYRPCCDEFKERPIAEEKGRRILLGIRAEESANRAHRGTIEHCMRYPRKVFVSPILQWKTAEVWEFIRDQALPYCSLYDEGWHRLGCVVCPFERRVAKSMARWPRIWENCRRALRRGWQNPDVYAGLRKRFRSSDAAFDWWCARDVPYPPLLSPWAEEEEQRERQRELEWEEEDVEWSERGPALFV